MELFDTHCHFETNDRDEIAAILRRAHAAGVTRLMAVGGSPQLNASALLARRVAFSMQDAPAVAVALGFDRDQAADLAQTATPPKCDAMAAVGEIGLDYYYSRETRADQLKLFGSELERARALGLPVVIHTREADDDTLALLREIPSRGIIHCFTGSAQFCRKLLDLGFFISISGIVTFRAADNVRTSALCVPDDRLLIETDAPFLAPVPMRGKRNEPAFVCHTAVFLANLRNTSIEHIAQSTTDNARALLHLD